MIQRTLLLALAMGLLAGCYSNLQPGPAASEKASPEPPPKKIAVKPPEPEPEFARTRRFEFVYETAVVGLKPGTKAKVWVPLPEANAYQEVNLISSEPGNLNIRGDRRFGNAMLYFDEEAGEDGRIPLKMTYVIVRREMLPRDGRPLSAAEQTKWVAPDALVPANDKPFQAVLGGKAPVGKPEECARKIFDATIAHVVSDKRPESGGPFGQGNSDWVCEAKAGDSVDLVSLYAALCRGLGIPVRMEFGFVLGKELNGTLGEPRAWARTGAGRWLGVDLHEARQNPKAADYWFGHLAADRVAFTFGRDLDLEDAAGPVNLIVYPYVEVGGKPYEKFEHRMHYYDSTEEEVAAEAKPEKKRGEE